MVKLNDRKRMESIEDIDRWRWGRLFKFLIWRFEERRLCRGHCLKWWICLVFARPIPLWLRTIDGLFLCSKFREINPKLLICILSARGEIAEKIIGLDQGADDYLSKPIHFDELLARIRALCRRNINVRKPLVEIGQLSIDINLRFVYVDELRIVLNAKEYQILEYLTQNIGRLVPAEELILHIWGEEDALFSNSVRTQISNLRCKLRKAGVINPVIRTAVNSGYTLVVE